MHTLPEPNIVVVTFSTVRNHVIYNFGAILGHLNFRVARRLHYLLQPPMVLSLLEI